MSPEDRVQRRKLVEQMKNKVEENPKTHYFIRGNKLCSEPKAVNEHESDEESDQVEVKLNHEELIARTSEALLKEFRAESEQLELQNSY